MLGTGGVPAVRQDLDLEAAAALAAVARGLQRPRSRAAVVRAGGKRPTAPITVDGAHSVADNAFTGMDSSASSARSSLAGRPNVVR